MSLLPPDSQIDTIRTWALCVLYAAMAILSTLLIYALLISSGELQESNIAYWASLTACGASAYFNVTASWRAFKCLREKLTFSTALMPFLFMALAMALVARLFALNV